MILWSPMALATPSFDPSTPELGQPGVVPVTQADVNAARSGN